MAPMPPDEYPNRITRARALMREHGMDGLIVTDTMHYSYYTGHRVSLFNDVCDAPINARLSVERHLWIDAAILDPRRERLLVEPGVDWGVADIIKERGLDSGA